jgi:hypothetical protein
MGPQRVSRVLCLKTVFRLFQVSVMPPVENCRRTADKGVQTSLMVPLLLSGIQLPVSLFGLTNWVLLIFTTLICWTVYTYIWLSILCLWSCPFPVVEFRNVFRFAWSWLDCAIAYLIRSLIFTFCTRRAHAGCVVDIMSVFVHQHCPFFLCSDFVIATAVLIWGIWGHRAALGYVPVLELRFFTANYVTVCPVMP